MFPTLQVEQGNGHAATQALLDKVYPCEQVWQTVLLVQVAHPVGHKEHTLFPDM